MIAPHRMDKDQSRILYAATNNALLAAFEIVEQQTGISSPSVSMIALDLIVMRLATLDRTSTAEWLALSAKMLTAKLSDARTLGAERDQAAIRILKQAALMLSKPEGSA